MLEHVNCLDHGYVRWIDHMGTDLSVVNAAKASFQRESAAMMEKERRLLGFLIREEEWSPFRHVVMTFECYAPLMIARQWWKYIVGSDHRDPMLAWNESSRRYVTEQPEYYTPEFRQAPESRKQGSGEFLTTSDNMYWKIILERMQNESIEAYEMAIEMGVAPEQARVFLLGYGLYVRWRWTCSLQGCIWFLQQRLEDKAQSEIREYAEAVRKLAALRFPLSMRMFDTTNWCSNCNYPKYDELAQLWGVEVCSCND